MPKRSRSFKAAAAKIRKYMLRFLENNWVCAAYALSPENRAICLQAIRKAYGKEFRFSSVIQWIKERLRQEAQKGTKSFPSPSPSSQPASSQTEAQHARKPPSNAFSSRTVVPVSIAGYADAWELWTAAAGSNFLENERESILSY